MRLLSGLEVRTEYLGSNTIQSHGSSAGQPRPASVDKACAWFGVPVVQLSEGLWNVFPTGLPPRLLVLGKGGMGKTMLTKQLVVELGTQLLRGGEGVVPFRVALIDVARSLVTARPRPPRQPRWSSLQ